MKIKYRIIKTLIENKEKPMNIAELSKGLGTDYKLIYLNVTALKNKRVLVVNKMGNTNLCSLTPSFNEEVFVTEYMRRDKFLENKDFLVLYNRLSTLNKQFILIVFGSQVNGTATKASDLDLLLISNKEDSKLIESEVALSPLKIHLTSTSYGDFIKMLLTKQQTVVSEAIKKNIILFGIEDYYRILNNAR